MVVERPGYLRLLVDEAPLPRYDEVLRDATARATSAAERDIAELALFLAGEHATTITGQTFAIDGGAKAPQYAPQWAARQPVVDRCPGGSGAWAPPGGRWRA